MRTDCPVYLRPVVTGALMIVMPPPPIVVLPPKVLVPERVRVPPETAVAPPELTGGAPEGRGARAPVTMGPVLATPTVPVGVPMGDTGAGIVGLMVRGCWTMVGLEAVAVIPAVLANSCGESTLPC